MVFRSNVFYSVLISAFIFSCAGSKLKKGDTAIDFTGVTPEGKKVALSDFKGKVVYIDCWASWCFPCRQEIPDLKKLQHFYKNADVVFMSVSIDRKGKEEMLWKALIKHKSLGGVQLRVEGGFKAKFNKDYGISQIPRFILVGRDGKIISSDAPRPSSDKEIKDLINENI